MIVVVSQDEDAATATGLHGLDMFQFPLSGVH